MHYIVVLQNLYNCHIDLIRRLNKETWALLFQEENPLLQVSFWSIVHIDVQPYVQYFWCSRPIFKTHSLNEPGILHENPEGDNTEI